ncbi:MAG: NifB/NifX family molybdenum-iron cluster-binding protein [Ignavibacteriaceae bacterium]
MLIAVSSTGNTPDSLVSEQFGRCRYFVIVNPDTMQFEAVSNPGEQMQNGAGPKAAGIIINKGVKVLLTGNVGDKAGEVLKKSMIKTFDGFKSTTKVMEAINQYLSKK